MKGLLIKDFLAQRRMTNFLALIFVVSVAIASGEKVLIFLSAVVGFMAMISGLVILSVTVFDEYSKWLTFVAAVPVSRRTVIIEKYVFALLWIIGTDLLFPLLGMRSGEISKIIPAIVSYSAVTLWYVITIIPLKIIFSVKEDGTFFSNLYLLPFFAPLFPLFFPARRWADRILEQLRSDPTKILIVLSITAASLLLSLYISIRAFEKEDL